MPRGCEMVDQFAIVAETVPGQHGMQKVRGSNPLSSTIRSLFEPVTSTGSSVPEPERTFVMPKAQRFPVENRLRTPSDQRELVQGTQRDQNSFQAISRTNCE